MKPLGARISRFSRGDVKLVKDNRRSLGEKALDRPRLEKKNTGRHYKEMPYRIFNRFYGLET